MDDLFSLALAARCQWVLATCLDPELTGDKRDIDRYGIAMERAEDLARKAAQAFPDEPCPPLLVDVPLLCDAFEHEGALVLADRAAAIDAAERDLARERERQHAEVLIANEDWEALRLPTPDRLTAKLLTGEPAEVCCHRLEYEEELDIVWFTSPYGVDGVLCSGAPDVATIKSFLIDMARGVEYGPIP
ncbi:hypothetical protein [Burkholderia ubonensis]|uniref:hypothetical protein n=1 Tax=Burkholderia ubonensis TaxID=101571 RepID=UPI000756302E|nr:hypothetical protein [Burkholderia ubonensis]KVZ65779.1 hypothetical protein WL19_23620 [Burkholderia ubonensis]